MSSNSPCYSSGPNDVWSLGIILVNLTCGRNPWKRASIDDSTFRAYVKNPRFLSSILPLSPELDAILRRIFECDPRRRINIPELRNLILRCPRFTTRSNLTPPTPSPEVKYCQEYPVEPLRDIINPFHQYPTVPYTPAPSPPIPSLAPQFSQLTGSSDRSSISDSGSTYSAISTNSIISSFESQMVEEKQREALYVPPKPHTNYYGGFIPLDPTSKNLDPQLCFHSVQVC